MITEMFPVYMLIGHGSKNQFKDLNVLEEKIKKIADSLPKYGSVILYFGDSPNKEKPDIGYAFKLLSDKVKKMGEKSNFLNDTDRGSQELGSS